MVTYTFDLDIIPGCMPLVIPLKQYEDDVAVSLNVYSRLGAFELQQGTLAFIRGTKPDGNGYSSSDSVSLSGNVVTFVLDKQMTAVCGESVFEVVFVHSEKELITATFILDVQCAAMDENTLVSESVIKEIADAKNKIDGAYVTEEGYLYLTSDGVVKVGPLGPFGISQETDPTVPSWAKQEKKPEYTYSEVGAEQNGAVSLHNDSASAHSELFVYKEDVSNKVDVIDAESTSYQYPTAKAVYDVVGDIETLLEGLR